MGKKKTRFNFLDFFLVLAVFALVAGIIWRQELSDKIEIRDIENTVTVKCEFEVITEGVKFSDGSTFVYMDGIAVGVVEKKTTQIEQEGSDSEGNRPVKVEKLSLKLSAVSKESGYYLEGGVKLFIDGEYALNTKTTDFAVRITSIEE